MLRQIYNLLYDRTPIQFTTQLSVAESVQRLARDVKFSAIHALFQEAAVGSVSESKVRLYRQPAFYSNTFQPIFVGSFANTDGETVLSGVFTLRLFVKIFMSIWFAAGFAFCLTGLVFFFLNREPETALALIASLGMISFVAAMVYLGKRISHQDIDWLARRIAVSLAEPAV